MINKKEIVETLLSFGVLKSKTFTDLKEASAKKGREPFEEALVSGILTPDALPILLSDFFDIPFITIEKEDLDFSLAKLVPFEIAWGEGVIPIHASEDTLTLGIFDAFKSELFRKIEKLTGKDIRIVMMTRTSVLEGLNYLYPPPIQISGEEIGGRLSKDFDFRRYLSEGDSKSLIILVLTRARLEGTEDLTFHHVMGRFFLEGRLGGRREVLVEGPCNLGELMFSGLRKLCSIGDGAIGVVERIVETGEGNRTGTYRVTLVEGTGSPVCVVKIIPNAIGRLSLDTIGFDEEQSLVLKKILSKEQGLYIVGSPTHDGVTTTLYSLVRYAQKPSSRIVAVEEEIRYKNEGFLQVEKGKAGGELPLKKIIRSLSPHVLMVDHLSLDSLAREVFPIASSRIGLFVGVEAPSLDTLVDSILDRYPDYKPGTWALRGLIFQRMVNLLCDNCKTELPGALTMKYHPEVSRLQEGHILKRFRYFIPAGCDHCGGTGYTGKSALFESIFLVPSVRMGLMALKSGKGIRESILERGRFGPEHTVIQLLSDGRITLEDALPFVRKMGDDEFLKDS